MFFLLSPIVVSDCKVMQKKNLLNNLCCFITQPFQFFVREQSCARNDAERVAVVAVDPLFLGVSQQRSVDGIEVEREMGHCLQLVELAEVGLFEILDAYHILYADTILIGDIQSRLVGDKHSRQQRSGIWVSA